MGGQGEGVLRGFKGFPDLPREAVWTDIIGVFPGARDSETADVYTERVAETLAEGTPMSGLSSELSETPHFRYGGTGLHIGDRVTAEINGQQFTDTLREVQLSWDKGGDLGTPIIGERADDPGVKLAKRLLELKRQHG